MTEQVSIASLTFADYNPRQIAKEDFESLKRSLKEFGFVEPVVVNKDNTVVGGHMRLRAATALGMTEVPVVRVDIPKTKEKALNLALNRIHGEWDEEKLAELIHSLKDAPELALTGFGMDEVNEILAGVMDIEDDDFDLDGELEKVKEPKAKLGDLYELGRHRLLCGDATKTGDYQVLLGEEKARLVITDPPYNVDYVGKTSESLTIQNDAMDEDDFRTFLTDALTNMMMVTTGAMYVFMSSSEWGTLQGVFRQIGGHTSRVIIWVKNSLVLGRGDYQAKFEPLAFVEGNQVAEEGTPILYGWPEGAKRVWNGGRKQTDVWHFDRPTKSADHPTMKPLPLIGRAVKNSSNIGDVVLDPFGGSGSTLMACDQLDRICSMMEIDPRYCDVIIKRWEQLTGEKAVRINGSA